AYQDRPQPIGEDATISAPHIVAEVTELLEVEKKDKILEIGSGSGYQAAILSHLAKEVVGMEINRELVEKSREKLKEFENVEIIHTGKLEDVEGLFDRILFSCAVESFEEAEEKLRPGGVIVGPVKADGGQVMKRFRDGELEDFFHVRYVEFQDST
ncbi:MAG: protein-L-isoaspartate O-methyltransferase, partial [Candidatus Nanohalobium sp.]